MVLPAGTALPSLPHFIVILAGALAIGALLRRERPAVTQPVVLALVPWMVAGASLHVLYQVGAVPPPLAPFFGTPAVYVSTAVVAGATWLLARRFAASPELRLAVVGSGLAIAAVAFAIVVGGVVRLAVPLAALVVGVALGVVVWRALLNLRPEATAASGLVGLLVLVGHAVDGVATTAGVDLLGFGERSPASRAIMDVAAALPTAEVLGVGWLFVLVKLAVAAAVVVLFSEYVRDEPTQGYSLLGLIAAVGLGPGAHNVLLFVVVAG